MATPIKKTNNYNNSLAINPLRDLIETKEIQNTITQTLGKSRVQAFIGSALTVSQDSKLADVEANSVFNCLLKAATYNLPIDPSLGFAYPVPYKKDGKKIAQFQLGTKGIIELAYRTNKYKRLNVKEVKQGELIGIDYFGEEEIKWLNTPDRSKLPTIGYMAAFELTNGMVKRLYWDNEKICAHANKYSKAHQYALKNKDTSDDLWSNNFDAMARKTLLKSLIMQYGPKSLELQNAFKFDQAVISRDNGLETPIYVDSTEDLDVNPNNIYDIDNITGEVRNVIAPEDIVITNVDENKQEDDEPDILYIDYREEYRTNKDLYEMAPKGDENPYNKETGKIRVRKKV